MPIRNKSPRYEAYLLRFWEELQPDDNLPRLFRFSLEDPHTGKRHGFPTLEGLIAFIREEIGSGDKPQQGVDE